MKNMDLHVKILLQKCWSPLLKILFLENKYKIVVPYSVQHMLHQIKAQEFYTNLGIYQQCSVLQKIVEFKDFSRKPSKFKYFSNVCEPC